jgi:F0F1-type ATP synthase membrane subunit c/vacuolar-type H+-ATPase subunit K
MKKRALLVGINYVGTDHELHGCINDSNNIKTFLSTRGFTEVKQILEENATTDRIKAGLSWLVADTQPGDVIVFHYSGHGSQLPSADEADGFEEIICPVDLDWATKIITDKDLRNIFNTVPNGVNTTVILDCCHSGTMLNQTESLNGTKAIPKAPRKVKGARYLKPPTKIKAKLKDRSLVNWSTSKDVNATALLIAGCHANQTSADANIGGIAQGAATAALLQAVSKHPAITYRELVTIMIGFMVSNKFTQVPELDGSAALYDKVFIEPFTFNKPLTPPDSTQVKKSNILLIISSIVTYITSLLSGSRTNKDK